MSLWKSCSSIDWFSSYFRSQKQFVTNNNERTGLMNIDFGVPQGLMLGTLLLYIYMYIYICIYI